MKSGALLLFVLILLNGELFSQLKIDRIMPVRGLCINTPRPSELDAFIVFIKQELVPRNINTLILQTDYNYKYETHPELSNPDALSKEEAKRIVKVCRQSGIKIIPQINLLGHQSWANKTGKLLEVYPGFDETPAIKMPEKYVWPNKDKLYCKSYCPLHPDLHKIVFELIDELCDVFDADAFHAGMDEVFYIGDDGCPRCAGKDKAELFAGEVIIIRDHLSEKGRKLWIWGDRLLDGKTTGLGEWEASLNDTYNAIDLIPKDVIICDWHYEKPEPTAVYFAMKGFNVVTCPWKNSVSAVAQANDIIRLRQSSTPEIGSRLAGMMQTVWSGTDQFMKGFANGGKEEKSDSPGNCFRVLFDEINKLAGK